MPLQDFFVNNANSTRHYNGAGTNYLVQTVANGWYLFFVDSNNDLLYRKSTDGGLNWGLNVTVFTGTVEAVSVWYDRWSNISAGLIHLAYTDSDSDDVLYRSVDSENSDALGTQTTIFEGASFAAGGCLSLTRTRGGNLLCHAVIDAGLEGGFFRSTDVGATWGSRTGNEAIATQDQIIMLPGWAADNQDAMAFWWDGSANEVSRYLYDDSANTWAETSIAASMTDTVTTTHFPHFAAAVDITNSQNLLVAWSAVDTLNADLRCWKVSESAITEMTNVVLNSTDDQGFAAIGIETNTQYWYVFYCGNSDGSETMNTSLNVYYKVSTDGGTTWGAETLASNAALTTKQINWIATAPRFFGAWAVSYFATTIGSRLHMARPVSFPRAQSLLGV